MNNEHCTRVPTIFLLTTSQHGAACHATCKALPPPYVPALYERERALTHAVRPSPVTRPVSCPISVGGDLAARRRSHPRPVSVHSISAQRDPVQAGCDPPNPGTNSPINASSPCTGLKAAHTPSNPRHSRPGTHRARPARAAEYPTARPLPPPTLSVPLLAVTLSSSKFYRRDR